MDPDVEVLEVGQLLGEGAAGAVPASDVFVLVDYVLGHARVAVGDVVELDFCHVG